ncbi:Thiol-disulfide isomerase/thioredoxin [Chitinophaga sp. 180180018-2]|uniref:TlpA family protein disulfide reductase n=1 Tax=Chitinophaga sp. 212800010-3 TaxID=3101735 RepID=UPI002DE43166|nr:Thiol-disulfide isomerase/thioredoxin [Chitinophaga sp. 212800010-3]
MKSYPGIFSALLLFTCFSALANDSAHVRFVFTPPLNQQNFAITVSDGIRRHDIDPKGNQEWHGELFAPYGLISIYYHTSDTSYIARRAFFKKGNSDVVVVSLPDTGKYYTIDEKRSVNLVPYARLGGNTYDAFIKEKQDAHLSFIMKNMSEFGSDTALRMQAFRMADTVTYKEFEFIQKFPDLYISFWVLQERILPVICLKPEEMLRYYNTVLPDKYKHSRSAEHVREILQNKVAITTNSNFPDFTAADINNNKIELSRLRGKYVLIQIWASWCGPCVREIPDLKIINDQYQGGDFRLISFNVDKDRAAFEQAVEKYAMNWTLVFGDDHIRDALSSYPIPQLYLIDKTGRTIYNNGTVKDDDHLSLLKQLLSERLEK